MIALSPPPPRLEMPDAFQHHQGSLPRTRRSALLAGAMGFFCFMPYAAVPIGRSTALQVGSLVSLLVLAPFLFLRSRDGGPRWIYSLLMVPLLLATVKAGMTHDDVALCMKSMPVWAIAMAIILATQVCAPQYTLELLTGIAVATILHGAVGALQTYYFSVGEFPLVWLYANPQFLSVQENADIIARYIQRPFGIFPEPSAMSSSIAPWVIFWIAEACGIVRLRRVPSRWQRILFMTAALLGLGLIIISRSGHAAITMAAVIVVTGFWLVKCKATPASGAAVMAVFGLLLPVAIYFAVVYVGDRMGGKSEMGNSSWEDRSDSLRLGFRIWVEGDWTTVLFGIGPGLTAPILVRMARLEAVWSVSLTYIYETGLVGVLVVSFIAWHLVRTWRLMRFDLTFALMLVVWLVGITLTTSYMELLTLWVVFAWLTVWPALCRASNEPVFSDAAHAEFQDPLLQTLSPVVAGLEALVVQEDGGEAWERAERPRGRALPPRLRAGSSSDGATNDRNANNHRRLAIARPFRRDRPSKLRAQIDCLCH